MRDSGRYVRYSSVSNIGGSGCHKKVGVEDMS